MPKFGEEVGLHVSGVKQYARNLAYLAAKLESIAEHMGKSGVRTISVRMTKSAEAAERRLTTFSQEVEDGLHRALSENAVRSEAEQTENSASVAG